MKYLIKISLVVMFLVTFVSCKKLLDIKETDLITENVALVTVENNEQAIIGAYGAMGGFEMGVLLNGVFSD